MERDAITACAKRFDGFRFFKKAGAGSHPDSSAIQRAAETSSAFAERDKDFGLFFGLWHHLFNCEGVYLPQTDVTWTALRRLFLNLCEVTVPDPYRCDVSRSYSGESLESAPLCEAAWGEKFVPILPQLKACVEERLQLYDGLTFEKLREMVVREDPISIGPEAGVLYEVYQLFRRWAWPETEEGSVQSVLLDCYAQHGRPQIVDDLKKARESARRVMLEALWEGVVQKSQLGEGEVPEHLHARNRIISDPSVLLSREECLDYLVTGMATGGSEFLKKLAPFAPATSDRMKRVKRTGDDTGGT